mgnify:CR=1 FL=1
MSSKVNIKISLSLPFHQKKKKKTKKKKKGDGQWVAFGDGFKMKAYFKWDMFFVYIFGNLGGNITKLGINNKKYFVTF